MVVSCDTSKIDNYPPNTDELEERWHKWVNEDYTGFKIGDRVQFIYTLNRDGNTRKQIDLYEKMKLEQPIGTITGFHYKKPNIDINNKRTFIYLVVEFDNKEFNVTNELVDLIPMQFVKVKYER